MFRERFRVQEERVTARDEEREEWERGLSVVHVVGFF